MIANNIKGGKMMKKLLVFLVMIGLLGILIGLGNVAVAVDQGINVTIGENITIVITPETVEFGAVLPGSSDNDAVEDVSFDPSGSNVDVNVAVTTVSGEPFNSGLKFDGILAEGEDYDILCVGNPCTYTPLTLDTTLDVPVGSPSGAQAGTITYTITGTTP